MRAVLSFVGVVGAVIAQSGELEEQIHRVLERARPAILRDLKRTRGEASPLVCLAALHDGLGPSDKTLGKALEKLSRANLDSTYALALRLMVIAECPDFPDRERVIKEDTELLLTRQNGGGFSYGPHDGWWDLSNTQYAALGLRAAASLGQNIPRLVWRSMFTDVLNGQKSDGGFSYRPGQGRTSADSSMTVAGIGVIEICRQYGELDKFQEAAAKRSIERAWQWMDAHVKDVGNRSVRSALYFHYGLERAAILSGKTEVGGEDWYSRGAKMIVRLQRKSGSFYSNKEMRGGFQGVRVLSNAIDTAFSVLFLRRAFRRTLDGPTTGACRCASLTVQANSGAIDRAVAFDVRSGAAIVPQLLRLLRSRIDAQRQCASKALTALCGQDFGYDATRSVDANADALKRAERWWLTEGRKR